ncbi:hypothetical protein E1B28_011234 [Marasmius oreades]|uniref:Uncharacterized protein n=1 Tax=Marasmius oreades TaxID=181124 RepID=A0A9P7RTV2_9AGAR|nr:uncharacterized protein E1B28_011234 [Marasmius oreades]KAG7089562.1 hypothetical protein E1B28_011234 [Marasmius oreades]
MHNGYTSPPIIGTNNPFSSDPMNPHNRFPEISASSPSPPSLSPQYTSWVQPGGGMQSQQPQQQQQYYQASSPPPQQFNTAGYAMNGGSGFNTDFSGGSGGGTMPQPTGFQPTSSFGQQLTSQINGSSYGYLNGQQQQPQQSPQSTYNPAQQQLASPSYIAQFDPYSSIGQGWDGSIQSSMVQSSQSPIGQSSGSSSQTTTTSRSVSGEVHPREYIRMHKAEIESWDSYAWKQLLNGFDTLKEAWQSRKKELEGKASQVQTQVQYSGGGYYAAQLQHEASRLQGLVKEADSKFESVAASSFQMHEVFQNYRQSGDMASKRRVRESCNAALQALPDWPSHLY